MIVEQRVAGEKAVSCQPWRYHCFDLRREAIKLSIDMNTDGVGSRIKEVLRPHSIFRKISSTLVIGTEIQKRRKIWEMTKRAEGCIEVWTIDPVFF